MLNTDDGHSAINWGPVVTQTALHSSLSPGYDIRGIYGAPVDGSVEMSEVAEMIVANIECSPMYVRWNPQADAPRIKVIVQESGESMTAQDGRQGCARPGDIYWLDSSRPFSLWAEKDTHHHSIEIPRALLGDHAWRFTELTATPIEGKRGPARFLRSFIDTLIEDTHNSDQRIARRLRDHAVQLMLTSLSERAESQNTADRSYKAQLRRAKAFILDHLDDPDLDVEAIAAGLKLSVRYLYCVFEAEGLTVARWVRQSRLDRCRRELQDQSHASKSICEIALQNGFNDSAYFSTAFRAAFGIKPRECRKSASNKANAC